MFIFFKNMIKGIFLGAGAILPGISSGVLCVILGIYEKLVNTILNLFKDFKNNFKFLLPLAIGGFIGVFIFGKILNYFFSNFPMQSNFAFMGLILGTTPALFKNCNKNGFKLHYLFYTFIAFILSIILIKYENSASISCLNINYSTFYYAVCGFFMSIGIVVPGVSSTVILMIMGIYNIYLESISYLNLYILIPIGIGLLIGSLIWLKLIQFLLNKFNNQTFFAIIGFVFGSIFIMYPGITIDFNGLSSVALFFLCIFISLYLEQKI